MYSSFDAQTFGLTPRPMTAPGTLEYKNKDSELLKILIDLHFNFFEWIYFGDFAILQKISVIEGIEIDQEPLSLLEADLDVLATDKKRVQHVAFFRSAWK